jgi:hypothetical protein
MSAQFGESRNDLPNYHGNFILILQSDLLFIVCRYGGVGVDVLLKSRKTFANYPSTAYLFCILKIYKWLLCK